MVAPKNFAWSFRDVAVFSKERVYLTAGHDKSSAKNIPVSAILRWTGSWESKPFDIASVSLCVITHPERNVIMLGNDGRVVRWGSKDFSEEHVDNSDQGPEHYGAMREVRTIGRYAYAVGMGRIVYRCEGQANWRRIDQGVRTDSTKELEAGFNSIDGFSDDELYAVGWDGEIWGYSNRSWTKFESPTNLALYRVVCASDGQVYAVGQLGLIVRGRHSKWEIIEQDATREDFWGATWFREKLFLATANGLFTLQANSLAPVDIAPIKKTRSDCFYRLSSAEDCIWSVGEKMAIYSDDGHTWSEVVYK
ncbi:hypothetical protein [Pseudomonas chlororaphis]|uniref:hypothetical protein n=1 Tax=Pseudomonas chlororaphis TaxID=587753 RepID=UPI0039E153DA